MLGLGRWGSSLTCWQAEPQVGFQVDLARGVRLNHGIGPCLSSGSQATCPVPVLCLTTSLSLCLPVSALLLCLCPISISISLSVCTCHLGILESDSTPGRALRPNTTVTDPACPVSVLAAQHFWPKAPSSRRLQQTPRSLPGHRWGGEGTGVRSWS